jgi:hypothetical protein
VPPDPAVVERVHEDHPDAGGGKAGLVLELHRAHVAQGIPLEQADSDGHPVLIDREGVRRLRQAPEAEPGMAARIALLIELGGIALGDALREATAVLLGSGGFRDQLVPIGRIRAQDLPVTHHQSDTIRVQLVLKQLEGAAQVALPAVRVPGEQQVEATRPEVLYHRGHRRRAPDGATAVGDLVHEPGVDETVPLDESVLLLAAQVLPLTPAALHLRATVHGPRWA